MSPSIVGVSHASEANPNPKATIIPVMTLRGSNRSKSLPIKGEQIATEMAAKLNACDICSRLHPKSCCHGLINKVKMVKKIVAIPVSTPIWQITTTRQPG